CTLAAISPRILAAKTSPTWHRRLRSKRSAARQRIHKARASRRRPLYRDLFLLSSHHTKPTYREVDYMGGKKQWANKDWQKYSHQQAYDGHGSWQLWRGAWATSPKTTQRGRGQPPARYDWTEIQDTALEPYWENEGMEEPEDTDSAIRKAMMKGLHTAKKADNRIRKLRQDVKRRRAQFQQFEKDLKQQYHDEQRRFENDMQKLEMDIEQATQAGQEASKAVQHIALHGPPATGSQEAEIGESWSRLMATPATTETEGPATDFLKEAMAAVQQAQRGPPAAPPTANPGQLMSATAAAQILASVLAATGVPVTPAQVPQAAPTMTAPPSTSANDPTTTTGVPGHVPYVPSPSTRKLEHPVGLSPGHKASPPARPKQRAPLKGQPIQPVHQAPSCKAIETRLEAKRQAALPFGAAPPPSSEDAEMKDGAPSATATIEDDDNSDHEQECFFDYLLSDMPRPFLVGAVTNVILPRDFLQPVDKRHQLTFEHGDALVFMMQKYGPPTGTPREVAARVLRTSMADRGPTAASAPPFRTAVSMTSSSVGDPPMADTGPYAGPHRFDRLTDDPTPEQWLHLDIDAESDEEIEPEDFLAGFHVLIPDYHAEVFQVQLRSPCTVASALDTVADTRDGDTAIHFDRLCPAHPQPDPSFACVLALPPWDAHRRVGVMDTRAIDGRLFAHTMPERLNRSSFLLHLEVPDSPGLQVYLRDALMDHTTWYDLQLGDTVTVLPADFRYMPGHSLSSMLQRSWGWANPCPTFGGVEGPIFCLLSEESRALLRVNLDTITTSAFFKQEAARLMRYELHKDLAPAGYSVSIQGGLLTLFLCLLVQSLRMLVLRFLQTQAATILLHGNRLETLPRQCKVLTEPEGQTAEERRHLRTLRALTRRLGGQWLPRLPFWVPGDPYLDPPMLEEDSDSDTPPSPHTIRFVVLKHDYTAEQVAATVQLPATQVEAEAALRQTRSPHLQRLFPILTPVRPQPLQGRAIYIASPLSNVGCYAVCLDTTAYDRRLFVAFVPAYFNRQILLDLANLPRGLDPVVWLAGENRALHDDDHVHATVGLLVAFLPAEPDRARFRTLGECLLDTEAWDYPLAFPEANQITAYCLAGRGQGHLPALSGQIFTVVHLPIYAPQHVEEAPVPAGPASSDTPGTGNYETNPQQQPDFGDAGQDLYATEGHGFESYTTSTPADFRLHFLLHTPEYEPELISLTVRHPLLQQELIDAVILERDSYRQRLFPQVIPVTQQPALSVICLLALPMWAFEGVPVLIACLLPPMRTLAVVGPSILTPLDVLRLAGVDETVPAQVFVADTPWALRWEDRFQVRQGDLITILPAEHPQIPPILFDSLLRLQEGQLDQGQVPYILAQMQAQAAPIGFSLLYRAVRFFAVQPPQRRFAVCILLCYAWQRGTANAMTVPLHKLDADGPTCPSGQRLHDAVLAVPRPLRANCVLPRGPWPGTADIGATAPFLCHETPPVSLFEELGPMQTLLEESILQPSSQAYLLAATLLDTLVEYFHDCQATSRPHLERISLDTAIPLTPHQQQCIEILDLLPRPAPVLDPTDWLDLDLQRVLADAALKPDIRTLLSGIRTWNHQICQDTPEAIAIYTDGSADPGAAASPCSWAFTVWFQQQGKLEYYGSSSSTAVPPFTPYHAGERDDTAVTAELLALFWSIAWTLQYAPAYGVPVSFHYDAISVGQGVFGSTREVAYAADPGQRSLPRSVSILRQVLATKVLVSHHHVKGHSGHFANEFTDRIAHLARQHEDSYYCRCLPMWPCQLVSHPLAPWAWLQHKPQHDLPTAFALESEAHRLQLCPDCPQRAPQAGLHMYDDTTGLVVFDWVCITYNVLTLKDKPAQDRRNQDGEQPAGLKFLGRRAVLQRSLAELTPLFVGLQETRLQETATLPDSKYFIFQSGATAAGVGGCALWVSKEHPYAERQSVKYYFRQEHATATGFSHRHINVTFVAPFLRLFVMVAHGPSPANHTIEEVAAFWKARAQDLATRPQGMEYLILTDANSKVGSVQSSVVGPCNAEPESDAGTIFHTFLAEAGAFLPSTYPSLHEGPGETWFSSVNNAAHRLDYIGIPESWQHFALTSKVLTGFESLQLREDHRPVYLRATFSRILRQHAYHVRTRQAIRPATPEDHIAKAKQVSVLAGLPTAPWQRSVDDQYAVFVKEWTDAGRAMQPPPGRVLTQCFLSETALDLIDRRKALRLYLSREEHERNRRLLLIAFAGFLHLWRATSFSEVHRAAACTWLADIDHSIARAVALLRHFAQQVRRQVSIDRNVYLHSLTEQVQHASPKDSQALYRAVRKAFPAARSSRRSNLQPLPAVYNNDGQLATTPEEKQECWRQHFASQELGEVVSDETYLDKFRHRPVTDTPVFDLEVVPSLPEVEQIILGLKKHKAPGPDSITADLLRTAPTAASRQLYPILLKSTLMIQEPVEFRGGNLICLAKKAGAALQCKDFRSILLASVPAKVQHRHLRGKLLPLLQQHGHPTQAGAKAGVGIEAISLLARSFQVAHQKKHWPWAMTFYDWQAAFYRVVRETLVPAQQDDATFRALLHRIGIPPASLEELANQLHRLAALPAMGTRPGDPAADILFSLSFAAFLKSVEASLQEQGLAASPLPAAELPPWAQSPCEATVGFPAWADDFAHLQNAAAVCEILPRVQRSTQLIQERATSIGMVLTYATDKTAVMLPPGCCFDPLLYLVLSIPELLLSSQQPSTRERGTAAAPPLAVARARALFLQKLTLHGPSVIRTFLYEHWIACPQGAWLSQLTDDVKLITLYVPAIQGMVSEGAAVHDLLDSFEADPTWWPKQTKRAERAFQKALDDWATQRQNAVVASESCPVETCTEPPPQPAEPTAQETKAETPNVVVTPAQETSGEAKPAAEEPKTEEENAAPEAGKKEEDAKTVEGAAAPAADAPAEAAAPAEEAAPAEATIPAGVAPEETPAATGETAEAPAEAPAQEAPAEAAETPAPAAEEAPAAESAPAAEAAPAPMLAPM
ncbi:PETs, partial [Symbiodinium microadriaticum]